VRREEFWRSCGVPVLLSLGVMTGLNTMYNYPPARDYAQLFPYPVAVYLLGGSGLALVLLSRALRGGQLSPHDAGLGLCGWIVPRRLGGLAFAVLVGYGQFAFFRAHPGERGAPTWGDYCFWYVFFLASSLAEVLVFVGVAYCLTEGWLRRRGVRPLWAAAGAGLFAATAFGLYHFSHPPRYHALIVPLTAAMFAVSVFFALTRNLYLTLALHNAHVAVGFTNEQYSSNPPDMKMFQSPVVIGLFLFSFVVPFLLLHRLEWRARSAAAGKGVA
jgi:hypothetical protein